MRIMDAETRKRLEIDINILMSNTFDSQDASGILKIKFKTGETIMDAIINDFMNTTVWNDKGVYSLNDIRFAIGSVITCLIYDGICNYDFSRF